MHDFLDRVQVLRMKILYHNILSEVVFGEMQLNSVASDSLIYVLCWPTIFSSSNHSNPGQPSQWDIVMFFPDMPRHPRLIHAYGSL